MKRQTRTQDAPRGQRLARAAGPLRRHPLALLAALAPALAAAVAIAAGAPAKTPAPSITSRPSDPTNQTSAQFHYSVSAPGASFQCQLDGAAFASCPAAGASYAGPLAAGRHTFKVRAVAGGKTGDEASYSWTVDTTPPQAAVTFPVDGSTPGSAAWGQGCPGRAGLCGTAQDAGGVTAVSVSIRQGAGKWWGGSSFDRTVETFLPASLASGRGGSTWGYGLALPADGAYTVHVRALDAAANATPPALQGGSTFTIDTKAPPAPTVSSGPDAQTTKTSATFAFADAEPGVSFQCRLDGARFKSCASPLAYPKVARGAHSFQVLARDGAGNQSAAATYTWTVVKTLEGGKPFTVTGNASSPLAPGFSSQLAVTIKNPNSVAITVTELNVTVAAASSKPGCEGPANLALTQSNLSASNPVVIAAGSQATLPNGSVSAPQVLMKDLPTNQDACKNASFTFDYSGSAHS